LATAARAAAGDAQGKLANSAAIGSARIVVLTECRIDGRENGRAMAVSTPQTGENDDVIASASPCSSGLNAAHAFAQR